tara:strand:+ start:3348 stop:3590 length:243 start_codon:yes stop_codon:yes gene_type:complete
MPLFYFDYDNGEGSGLARDAVGSDLVDIGAAVLEASHTMAELAADALPGCHERLLAIVVRDDLGAAKARLSLAFRAELLG